MKMLIDEIKDTLRKQLKNDPLSWTVEVQEFVEHFDFVVMDTKYRINKRLAELYKDDYVPLVGNATPVEEIPIEQNPAYDSELQTLKRQESQLSEELDEIRKRIARLEEVTITDKK